MNTFEPDNTQHSNGVSFMPKVHFYFVLQVLLGILAFSAAVVLTFALGQRLQEIGRRLPVVVSTATVWMLCAFVVFLVVVFLLRLTRVSWFLSVVGGAGAMGLYSILVYSVIWLLIVMLTGWAFG